jgi:cell division protein FtsX
MKLFYTILLGILIAIISSFVYLGLIAFIYNESYFWAVSTSNVGIFMEQHTRFWMMNRVFLVVFWILSFVGGFAIVDSDEFKKIFLEMNKEK